MGPFLQNGAFEASPQSPFYSRKDTQKMQKLSRPIEIKVRVNALEKEKIKDRMRTCGITNMTRYMRTMAINGCIIQPDHSSIKKANYELHKIGININQIAKKANQTGVVHTEDLKKIEEMLDTIWQLQKYILSEEP